MSEDSEYIKFDIIKISDLEEAYECSMEFLLESLPRINYNSSSQVCNYIKENLGVDIQNMRINTLIDLQKRFNNSMEKDFLDYLIAFLKMKYTVKNYLRCILRHHKEGVVLLRTIDGRLCLPNRQPLSYNEEIINCIIEQSSAAKAATTPLF